MKIIIDSTRESALQCLLLDSLNNDTLYVTHTVLHINNLITHPPKHILEVALSIPLLSLLPSLSLSPSLSPSPPLSFSPSLFLPLSLSPPLSPLSLGNWSPSDFPEGSTFPPYSKSKSSVNRDMLVVMKSSKIVDIFEDVFTHDWSVGVPWEPKIGKC